jgi:hypothetical protein
VLTLWTGFHGLLDERDPVGEWACGDVDKLEAQVAIGLLVDSLEGKRVRETDSPGGGGQDESLVPDEEDGFLEAAVRYDAVNFAGKRLRRGESQVATERQRAHRRTVEEGDLAVPVV